MFSCCDWPVASDGSGIGTMIASALVQNRANFSEGVNLEQNLNLKRYAF